MAIYYVDGKKIESLADTENIPKFGGFNYPKTKYKEVVFDTTGDQTSNLFKIEGSVMIECIYGHVTTAIGTNLTAFQFELWDGTNATSITKNDGVLSSLPEGSFFVKTGKLNEGLDIESSATANTVDEIDDKKAGFRLIQKAGGVDTYIRAKWTSTDTPPSGEIHVHIEWKPQTELGFVSVV